MTTPARPRLEVRLRDPQLLRDAMDFSRLTVRGLSEACGSIRHRSTIGHLLSGARTSCSPALAARIERVLRVPAHNLFQLNVSTPTEDTGQKSTMRRAA